MKKLIEFLFSGCWHEWETIKEEDILPFNPFANFKPEILECIEQYSTTNILDKYKKPKGTYYTMRCKKCGEITSRIIRWE